MAERKERGGLIHTETVKMQIPSIKNLAQLYQRAIAKDDKITAAAAEQTVLSLGRAEAAIAESTVLASFLDEV